MHIRLQYLQFWDDNFYTDITYRYLHFKLICNELEMSPHALKTYARSLQFILIVSATIYGIKAFSGFPILLMCWSYPQCKAIDVDRIKINMQEMNQGLVCHQIHIIHVLD